MTKTSEQGQGMRRQFVFVLAAIVLVTLAWYVKTYFSLEELGNREQQLRLAIAARPWRAFFIGFGVYTAVAFVPGTGGKAILFGWLFGFWQAFAIVTVGLAIAAMSIFALSRYLFQAAVERHHTHFLSMMNRHLERDGAFYLVTLRLLHVPYSIINPVSGASRVDAMTFFWTTVVGLAPSNAIWAYVGFRLPTLYDLAEHGARSFIDWPLIAVLVVSAILPFVFRWAVRKYSSPGTAEEIFDATTHDLEQSHS
jgi:uncharacterized membrane protein YdjX (TVP38/TMEM64 family)